MVSAYTQKNQPDKFSYELNDATRQIDLVDDPLAINDLDQIESVLLKGLLKKSKDKDEDSLKKIW